MKTVTITCILLLATLVLNSGMAGTAAAEQIAKPKPSFDRSGKYFSISMVFSGALKNEVSVYGTPIRIREGTVLRGIGGDLLGYGHHVVGKSVYITGVVGRDGSLTATMVIVRDGRRSRNSDQGELPADAVQ